MDINSEKNNTNLDVSFIWGYLSDFWVDFQHKGVVEQLWRGYVNIINSLYIQLYQTYLMKSIFTIPHEWVTKYDRVELSEDNSVVPTAQNSWISISQYENLPNKPLLQIPRVGNKFYPFSYTIPSHIKDIIALKETACAITQLPKDTYFIEGTTCTLPAAFKIDLNDIPPEALDVSKPRTLRTEVVVFNDFTLPKGTIINNDGTIDIYLGRRMHTPDGKIRFTEDYIYEPEEIKVEGDTVIFPQGASVDAYVFNKNEDYIVDSDNNIISFRNRPPEVMWTDSSIKHSENIYNCYGTLLNYYKPDSYDYLREVQSLWYSYWNGATLSNMEKGLSILMNRPFAKEAGRIDEIKRQTRSLILGNITSQIPITVSVEEFDSVQQHDPISFVDKENGLIVIGGSMINLRANNILKLTVLNDEDVSDRTFTHAELVSIISDVIKTGVTLESAYGDSAGAQNLVTFRFSTPFSVLTVKENMLRLLGYHEGLSAADREALEALAEEYATIFYEDVKGRNASGLTMQVNNLAEFQIAHEQNPGSRRVVNTTKMLDASDTPIGIQILIGGTVIRVSDAYMQFLSTDMAVKEKQEPSTQIILEGTRYDIPAEVLYSVTAGSTVEQFQPLTDSISVEDYVSSPSMFREMHGGDDIALNKALRRGGIYFDTSYFDIVADGKHGIFDAYVDPVCSRIIYEEYFTFIVSVSIDSWFESAEAIAAAKVYLNAIKPVYTNYILRCLAEYTDEAIPTDTLFWVPEERFQLYDSPRGYTRPDGTVYDPGFLPTPLYDPSNGCLEHDPGPCHMFDDPMSPYFDNGDLFDRSAQRDELIISQGISAQQSDYAVFLFDSASGPIEFEGRAEYDEYEFDAESDYFELSVGCEMEGIPKIVEVESQGTLPENYVPATVDI